MRSALATLVLSQVVPMIGCDDEVARARPGDDSPPCQDTELAETGRSAAVFETIPPPRERR